MSVYRTLDEGPQSEFSVQRVDVKRKRSASSGAPRGHAHAGPHMRKAAPVEHPLPATFKWIARLPREVRPLALLRKFPRVANTLATGWVDSEAFRNSLYDLLIDRRGSRNGFPPDVLAELLALRTWFDELEQVHRARAGRSPKPPAR